MEVAAPAVAVGTATITTTEVVGTIALALATAAEIEIVIVPDIYIDTGEGRKEVPVYLLSRTLFKHVAQNVELGMSPLGGGHPNLLQRALDGMKIQRRRAALRGFAAIEIDSDYIEWDEYPFASTYQGGEGASVSPCPPDENWAQGQDLNYFYIANKLEDRDWFYVLVIP